MVIDSAGPGTGTYVSKRGKPQANQFTLQTPDLALEFSLEDFRQRGMAVEDEQTLNLPLPTVGKTEGFFSRETQPERLWTSR